MKRSTYSIYLLLVSVCLGNPLGELLRLASERHPVLLAERAVVEQAFRSHEELAEYLDPVLYGAAGGATRIRDLPIAPVGYDTVSMGNVLEGQAGVRIPLESVGAVVSAGGAFRRWFSPEAPYDSQYQHLLGVNLQVPLGQDRGFALYGHRRAAALASCSAAVHRLQQAEQQVRREVEAAYIRLCVAEADCLVWGDATERFRRLHQEAGQLAELKAIPQYQVQTALRELQGGLADEAAAHQGRESAALALGQAMGLREPQQARACTSEELLEAALALPSWEEPTVAAALERRGSYLALKDEGRVVESEAALEAERRKDQVTLQAGVTWQGDSSSAPLASYRESTDHHWGGGGLLVWSRPLDYTGPEAALARLESRRREVSSRLEAKAVEIVGEIRGAQLRLEGARRRLSLVREGVQAARKTLEAEQERFRLGESTSAIVLDAQKELNNILLRQNATAAELLLAYSELQYALGYPQETPLL